MQTKIQRNTKKIKTDIQTHFPGAKKIYIFFKQQEYPTIIQDHKRFLEYLDTWIETYPELFPSSIQQGYILHDILPESKKIKGIQLRRIQMVTQEGDKPDVYTIHPSFVIPYMTGYTEEVEKALYLHAFNVPFYALTHVLGHDDMHWYRIITRLGLNSLVGTTIKEPENLPDDVLADEKTPWEALDNQPQKKLESGIEYNFYFD